MSDSAIVPEILSGRGFARGARFVKLAVRVDYENDVIKAISAGPALTDEDIQALKQIESELMTPHGKRLAT